MVTNTKLYEMISEQMNNSNEDLRESLRSQIADKTSQVQTMAQGLADRQSAEIMALSDKINTKLNNLKNEISFEINNAAESNSEMIINKLTQDYDEKLKALKSEILEKLDESFYVMLNANKSLSDGIANIQKDTAVIMETLQLILTNMMLNNVQNLQAELADEEE